jgi:uncharacterized protein YjbI with pentapeptide repeats
MTNEHQAGSNMKRVISQDEFLVTHAKHVAWLRDSAKGCRMNFAGCILPRINMSYANMTGAILHGADMSYTDMSYADMSYADMSYANLKDVDMSWTILTRANLTGANMEDANMYRADMALADLTGASLDFSAWPLSCGSLTVRIDAQIAAQLAYHLLRVWPEAKTDLVALANSWKGIEKHELRRIEL